jgi:FkbM family methyltransferase
LRDLGSRRVRSGPGAGLRIGLRHASADYSSGSNEQPVQEAFVAAISPGDVVFDIGANVGFFSLIAARAVGPQGAVHAFEAVPECAREVERNARRNGLRNVRVHALAVADVDGTIELLRSRHPGGATVSQVDRPRDFTEALTVPATTLDRFVARGGVRPPNVVKIDVEGAERSVLTGMAGLLRDARPVVVCEVDDRDPARAAAKLDEVSGILTAKGYSVRTLAPSYEGSPSTVLHLVATPG